MNRLINNAVGNNDFPTYSDGDVLVVLNPEQHFQLHSLTLRTNSDFFRELLIEENAVNLASKARKGGATVRWRVELEMPTEEGDSAGTLRLRELDPHSKPRYRDSIITTHFPAGQPKPLLHQHYTNLLRCYYHLPPRFASTTSANSFALTLRDVVGLTDIAEHLGSIPCVSAAMDVALLNQGETLYRSIASNPPVWADLAVRVRSEIMFRESVIHLVGQWNTITNPSLPESVEALSAMRSSVRGICETKNKDLDELRKAVELRVLGHYPAQLQVLQPGAQNVGVGSRTKRGAVNAAPTRQSAYSNKVMDWMALNLFRHWVGQSIAGDMSRSAPDGGYGFYSAIGTGKETYLDQAAREAFCRHFPLSAKARTQFDRAVWDIKEGVKGFVGQLVMSRCQLDVGKWPVEWLTCVEVRSEEMPWVAEEMRKKEVEGAFNRGDGDAGGEDGDAEMETGEEVTRQNKVKEGKRKLAELLVRVEDEIDEDGAASGGHEMLRRIQKQQDRKSKKEAASPMAKGVASEVAFHGRTRGDAATVAQSIEDPGEAEPDSDGEEDARWSGNAFASGGGAAKRTRGATAEAVEDAKPAKRQRQLLDGAGYQSAADAQDCNTGMDIDEDDVLAALEGETEIE